MVKQRAGALMEVIRSAAPIDPDIAALWEPHPVRLLRQPARDRRGLARQEGAAAGPRRRPRATDILWTLNHPDVWLLLVGQRGWTPEEYEQWFADTACAQLLGDGSRSG